VTTSRTRAGFLKAIPFLAVLAAAWFAHWMSLAPRPVPASSPPDAFSAERAHRHIGLNCTEPQPAGSIPNDRACRYIQEELQRMGVETELILRYEKTGERRVSRWRAVLGRIPGTDSTKAFRDHPWFQQVGVSDRKSKRASPSSASLSSGSRYSRCPTIKGVRPLCFDPPMRSAWPSESPTFARRTNQRGLTPLIAPPRANMQSGFCAAGTARSHYGASTPYRNALA
jgi:hypothetical protein